MKSRALTPWNVMRYGLEFAGERRRGRRTWGRTVMDVLMLLALAALCGWLWSCVGDAAVSSFRFQVSGLAMAPLSQGVVYGLLLSFSVLTVVIAVRKTRENDHWFEQLRQRQMQRKERAGHVRREFWENGGCPHDVPSFTEPLPDADEGIRAPGMALPPEDLRRIVGALLAETVQARLFVRQAQAGFNCRSALEAAEASLNLCVGCLRGLVERTQAGSLCHDEEGRLA